MVTYLAQAAAATSTTDIASYTQEVFKQLIGIDVAAAFKILIVWLLLIWLVFALWVAIDAANRYKNILVALFWFLFVLPFNVLGFIGYLFMRPTVTLDEKQWTKLESKYLMYELSTVNDCPNCGTLVPVGQNFCSLCGTMMNVACPKCESSQSIYNSFCNQCGHKIATDENPVVMKQKENVSGKSAVSLREKLAQVFTKAKSSVSTGAQSFQKKVSEKMPKKGKKGSTDKGNNS